MRALRLVRDHAELAFALTCTVALQVEIWFAGYATHRPALSLLGLAAALPLVVRCRYPLAAFLCTMASFFAISRITSFDRSSTVLVIVVIFALYSYGANARGRQAWAAAVVLPLLIANFVTDDGDSFHWGDIVFGALIIGGPWLAGLMMRLRRERERSLTLRTVELERDQEEHARAAVVEERQRIARELHDVVAHAISVVVVQARGGRKVLDRDPAAARTAFDSIERTGEQALGEMRRLLGMLHDDDEERSRAPQPTLARLDALAEQMRASGLPVELEIEGEANGIPPGIDVSGYRIVQEALTNVLRHAGPAIAHVDVRFSPDAVEIDVVDDGRGGQSAPGTGNGLLGIRERVAVVGGEIDAGPLPDGGFAVHARLPYRDDP